MGEMADDAYDRALDELFDDEDYGFGWGYTGPVYRSPRCDRCQSKHVYWTKTRNGHRLNEIGTTELHTCPTSAEGFEDEPV